MKTSTFTSITGLAAVQGNQDDRDYDRFLRDLQTDFASSIGTEPLFTTSSDGLWDLYLGSLPAHQRQHHQCNCCRHFVERFGSLVTVDRNGRTLPAVWHPESAPALYRDAIDGLRSAVASRKITGVFVSDSRVLGTPITDKWVHMSLRLPLDRVHTGRRLSAGQVAAERREDHKNVLNALSLFTVHHTSAMMQILDADVLYRDEKVKGPAKWFHELCQTRNRSGINFANLVWRAVATAPPGFAHVRSSMTGTLLDDLAAGLPVDDVIRKFKAKMHPLQYQRPQAPPAAGNIRSAEKIVEKLGIAKSLERRHARPDEIRTFWTPRPSPAAKGEGVFGHLVPKGTVPKTAPVSMPSQTVTWVKFRDRILPDLVRIEVELESAALALVGFATAVHADAPPILQWDQEDARNPVSWYLYNGGSTPSGFSLAPRRWLSVWGMAERPSHWTGRHAHFGDGIVLMIEGAKDVRNPSACLFPEILKSELREVRSTIESHSRSARLSGEGSQSGGILVDKSGLRHARLRGYSANGSTTVYKIDRWD